MSELLSIVRESTTTAAAVLAQENRPNFYPAMRYVCTALAGKPSPLSNMSDVATWAYGMAARQDFLFTDYVRETLARFADNACKYGNLTPADLPEETLYDLAMQYCFAVKEALIADDYAEHHGMF